MDDSVQDREAAFWDDAWERDVRAGVRRWYGGSGTREAEYHRVVREHSGQDALEIGCGRGAYAFELSRLGVRVIGTDISPVAVGQANSRAAQLSVPARFEVADAEALPYEDESFDLVFGTAIIHHLVLERSLPEIARVLRPGGVAVFTEPQGHNPLINIYRRLTPKLRTPDEHPLVSSDYAYMRRLWGEVDISYFHLTSPLAGRLRSEWATSKLERVDSALFRRSALARRWAWYSIIVARNPRRAT